MDNGASPDGDRAAHASTEPVPVSAVPVGIPSACRNCAGEHWVCENHADRPWGGMSADAAACECGAGMPCPVCRATNPWQPIRCYAEKYDGRDVLISGGTYYYDAETFQIERPFAGWGRARLDGGEWCGGYGSEYDGQYWHKPEWYMRVAPLPAQGMAARSGETGTGSTEGNSAVAASDAPKQGDTQ